jgi:predicted SAM-dependent methyltransferase
MGEIAARWSYHGTNHFRAQRAAFLQSREDRAEVVRLHIGCGGKRFRGYINIDAHSGDLQCDVTRLPYSENTADEIIGIHLLEHLFPHQAIEALKHWCGILKPGGKLILEMPDLKKILEFFKDPKASPQLTIQALYGGELTGRIEDIHKFCWTFETLEPHLKAAGFTKVEEKHALYHMPVRDFRVEAVK